MAEGSPSKGVGVLTTLFAVVFMLFTLSIFLLYLSTDAYSRGRYDQGLYYLLFGVLGFAISTYLLTQTRGRTMAVMNRKPSRTLTLMECIQCGFKTIRGFQKGDFVLKEAENCPKCSKPMIMSSVYLDERRD